MLRVLTREDARSGSGRVVDELLALARRLGLTGITVTRALEGYSTAGGLRTAGWADLGSDLPLVIEIVDRAGRIERALPAVTALLREGAVTVTETTLYLPDTSAGETREGRRP